MGKIIIKIITNAIIIIIAAILWICLGFPYSKPIIVIVGAIGEIILNVFYCKKGKEKKETSTTPMNEDIQPHVNPTLIMIEAVEPPIELGNEEETDMESFLKTAIEAAYKSITIAIQKEKEYDFNTAKYYYDKATTFYKSYYILYKVADFYYKHHKFEGAIYYFRNCLDYAKTEAEKLSIYNNLGNSYISVDDHSQALSAYENALKIYRNLSADDCNSYRLNTAITHTNLGHVLCNQKKHTEAEFNYLESLKIHEELAVEDAKNHLWRKGDSLANLAEFYLKSLPPDKKKSKKYADEIFSIHNNGFGIIPPDVIERAEKVLNYWRKKDRGI